jgi:hypothetical protein
VDIIPLSLCLLLLAYFVAPIVWTIVTDDGDLVPPSGGTALELPGGFYLGQNRRILLREGTGTPYARDVSCFAVMDDWIAGQDGSKWFLVNWKTLECHKDMDRETLRHTMQGLDLDVTVRFKSPLGMNRWNE